MPIAERRGSKVRRRTAVSIIETIKTSRRACMVVLSALFVLLCSNPAGDGGRDPAPRPLLRPITTMNMGLTNPTAARAIRSQACHQMAFTRL